MRKLLACVLALAVFMLAGCEGSQVVSSASASASISAPAPQSQSSQSSSSTDGSSAQAETSSTASSITLRVNGESLAVTLSDTEAASALAALLQNGPIEVGLHSYGGFEKVGPLPQPLPASDERITAAPGDIMLYQGNQITIFYGSNTWDYTPLGHIEGATAESLLTAFGEGDVAVELSL